MVTKSCQGDPGLQVLQDEIHSQNPEKRSVFGALLDAPASGHMANELLKWNAIFLRNQSRIHQPKQVRDQSKLIEDPQNKQSIDGIKGFLHIQWNLQSPKKTRDIWSRTKGVIYVMHLPTMIWYNQQTISGATVRHVSKKRELSQRGKGLSHDQSILDASNYLINKMLKTNRSEGPWFGRCFIGFGKKVYPPRGPMCRRSNHIT